MEKLTLIYNLINIFNESPFFIKIITIITLIGLITMAIYYSAGLIKLSQDNFYIRSRTVVRPDMMKPGRLMPLIYFTGSSLKPVDVAILIEITNRQSVPATIFTYKASIQVGQRWIKMNILPPSDLNKLFWCQDNGFKVCRAIEFLDGLFDAKANNRLLQQGESIKGWVFLSFPSEERKMPGRLGNIRFYVENSLGKGQTCYLKPKNAERGDSTLSSTALRVGNTVDLSKYKLVL